jgi:tRNA 2-thiouridine synthesizing protein A
MASGEELEEFQEEPSIRLNTVGLICPYPALETQKALRRMEEGQVLEVVTNNEPTAKRSIPLLCEQGGSAYRIIEEGDRWRILIRK